MPPSPTSELRSDASAELDIADGAFAAMLAAFGMWSWVGISLAEAGRFEWLWLVVLAGPASVVAAAIAWRSLAPVTLGTTSTPAVASLVVVVALGACLAARPGEYLVDGSDASVYLNIGTDLARHHALVRPEPLLDLMPAPDWEAVLGRERNPPRVLNLFPGGIQVVPGINLVRPNFFHLFPVWVAIADVMGGPRAPYYVSPVFSIVAIVAFWLVARALTSALVATLAALLLSANFAQIWFARVPTSEIMAQAFTLSGVYFAVCCYRRPTTALGVLTGVAFGLAAFVRIDVLMFVTPLVAGFLGLIALERRWCRPWTWAAIVLGTLTLHAVAHALLVSAPYTERILFHTLRGSGVSTASRVLPPLVLAAGAGALLVSRRFGGSVVARHSASIVFILVLSAAAFRLWPQLTGGYLLMLMSPPGIGLVLAGLAVWLLEDRSPPALLVAGLLMISTLVYGESVRDRSMLPMLLRRFVPVILPLSILVIGVLVARIGRRGVTWRAAAITGWAALTLVFASNAWPLVASAPMTGVHEQLARMASALPESAVVVTDETTPSHFGLSLRGTFGRDVLSVRPVAGAAAALERLSRHAGRPLVIARGPAGAPPRVPALTARELTGFSLSAARVESLATTEMESTTEHLPSVFVRRTATIEFYVARPRDAALWPETVEIGAADLAGRLDGFYDAEQMGDASARWTDGLASVQLPRCPASTRATLVLRLAAPRAAGMAPPVVHLELDGVALGATPPLGPGFQEVEVLLAEASRATLAAGPTVLTLSAPTFVPAEHGMGGDRRPLGAVVDWIRLEAR